MAKIIDDYTQHLKEKFPSCKVESLPWGDASDADVVLVSKRRGDEWFEIPFLFSKDITQEQFRDGEDDLDRYELEINKQLLSIEA